MTRAVVQQTQSRRPAHSHTALSFLFLLCDCQSKLMQLMWPWAESKAFRVCQTAIPLSGDEKHWSGGECERERGKPHKRTHRHVKSCFVLFFFQFEQYLSLPPSTVFQTSNPFQRVWARCHHVPRAFGVQQRRWCRLC